MALPLPVWDILITSMEANRRWQAALHGRVTKTLTYHWKGRKYYFTPTKD